MDADEMQEAATRIEQNIASFREMLTTWPAHMAARYGAPVLLLGSVLHSPTPRDVDIRIVIDDAEFIGRYDIIPSEWPQKGPSQAWIDDIAKYSRVLSRQTFRNVDFQVWPKSHWRETFPVPLVLAAPSPRWFVHNAYNPHADPAAPARTGEAGRDE